MTNNDKILIALIIIMLIALLFIIIFRNRIDNLNEETSIEVIDTNDSPLTKAMNNFHQTTINNIIYEITDLLQVKLEDLTIIDNQTNFDQFIITVIYNNNLWRIYVNWKRNTIQITYNCKHIDAEYHYRKYFFCRNNAVSFEKIGDYLKKVYEKAAIKYERTHNSSIVELVQSAKDVAAQEINADDILLDAWESLLDKVRSKHKIEDSLNFIRLTTYLIKNKNEKVLERLKKNKDLK